MKAEALYQQVTNDIVRMIEEGANGSNWRMPWERLGASPTSQSSGKPYRGINWLILSMEQADRGYKSNRWATYRQWTAMSPKGDDGEPDGSVHVRKGESGTHVFLWKKEKPSKVMLAKDPDAKPYLLARTFTVFNRDQVEGLAPEPTSDLLSEHERWEQADAYFAAIGADVRVGGDRAFYAPVQDYIAVPLMEQFRERDHYYTTLAHEHAHWTGHADRVNRDLSGRFGDRKYAAEELVAELSAAFWGAQMGLEPAIRRDHAEYVGSWVQSLRDDPKAIVTAASKAQGAVDYLNTAAGWDGVVIECEAAA